MIYQTDFRDLQVNKKNLKTAYYEDGVFLVRRLFEPSSFVGLARTLDALLSRRGGKQVLNGKEDLPSAIQVLSRYLIELHQIDPSAQRDLYDAVTHSPELIQFAVSPSILAVIKTVLFDHVLVNPRMLLLMGMPTETWHLAQWHQDYFYNAGPEDTCTLYLPLQNTTQKNGGLRFALRELSELHPHIDADVGYQTKWKSIKPEVVNHFKNIESVDLHLGDALFFHSLTPHSPSINTSSDVRFVMNFRYQNIQHPEFSDAGWRIPHLADARNALNRRKKDEVC